MDATTQQKIDLIRRKIRRARFAEALDDLDLFIEALNNRELDRLFTLVSARFNAELKEYNAGGSRSIDEKV